MIEQSMYNLNKLAQGIIESGPFVHVVSVSNAIAFCCANGK